MEKTFAVIAFIALTNTISAQNSDSIVMVSTAYEFPEMRFPFGFYVDTISVYDSVSRAQFITHCLQSTPPEMEIFNQSIIEALKERIDDEKSYLEPWEHAYIDPVYTYKCAPVGFYSDEHVVSVVHIIDTYTAHGNHHNYSWYTFNYNLRTNSPIKFEDVFSLKGRTDSIAFVDFVHRHKEGGCMDWGMPFDSVDFSFDDNGIYINPELSWACGLNRSLLPEDSLYMFVRESWLKQNNYRQRQKPRQTKHKSNN